MSTTSTAGQVREAVRQLELRGHCKGISEDRDGRVCAAGAVALACGSMIDEPARSVMRVLDEVAAEQYPDRIRSGPERYRLVVLFNDHPDTTVAEVVAVLEKAAARLEEA